MNISGIEIGSGHPCRIVAEVSNNHNGDLSRALRLLDAIKASGADFAKFQCYTPDELVALRGDGPAPAQWGARGWTMRDLYTKAQTPLDWFPTLADYCDTIGLPWFSSVFGLESLAVLEAVECPAYKIAALDSHHRDLIVAARHTGKLVLVSSATERRLHFDGGELHSLYCPPNYPTAIEDIHLPWFYGAGDDLSPTVSNWLGLSSHCLAPELPIAAVARGAKVLEYHVHLAAEPSLLEANISLTEQELAAMVAAVRVTERMLA